MKPVTGDKPAPNCHIPIAALTPYQQQQWLPPAANKQPGRGMMGAYWRGLQSWEEATPSFKHKPMIRTDANQFPCPPPMPECLAKIHIPRPSHPGFPDSHQRCALHRNNAVEVTHGPSHHYIVLLSLVFLLAVQMVPTLRASGSSWQSRQQRGSEPSPTQVQVLTPAVRPTCGAVGEASRQSSASHCWGRCRR